MNSNISKYTLCLDVVELKKNIEVAYLSLAKRLQEIRDKQMFTEGWESFDDFLDEVKINKSVASRLISVYEKFIVQYGLEPSLIANAGGWSNAYELSKLVNTREEAQQWLEEASVLTPKDTKIRIREERSGIKQDECSHEDTYTITICRKCNMKIYEIKEDNKPA